MSHGHDGTTIEDHDRGLAFDLPRLISIDILGQSSLDGDNLVGDGYAGQLASASGSVDSGFEMKLNVGV